MEEEDIFFEEMSDRKGQDTWMKWDAPKPKAKAHPDCVKEHYSSLYEELKAKCDPKNFMKVYEYKTLETANDLYASVGEDKENVEALKVHRRRASLELGVKFATEELYEELVHNLNPVKFSGCKEKFSLVNGLYNEVLAHADDVEALEEIRDRVRNETSIIENYVLYADIGKSEGERGGGCLEELGKLLVFFFVVVTLFIFVMAVSGGFK